VEPAQPERARPTQGEAPAVHPRAAGGFRIARVSHDRPVPLHAHALATVTVVLDGSFVERYPGSTRAVACGAASVLFRPAGAPHRDQVEGTGAHCLTIEVEPHRAEALRECGPMFEDVVRRSDPWLFATARRIARELAHADASSALALEGLTLELLAYAARAAAGPELRAPAWLRRARDQLRGIVRDGAGPPPRVEDLAREAGVHPVYFARAFRASFGESPGAYHRRVRLEWAAGEVAAARERPLADIALAAGFADQSHFTRTFRTAFGVTPGQWRALRV
jgi:AraC family transcriptional regulator